MIVIEDLNIYIGGITMKHRLLLTSVIALASLSLSALPAFAAGSNTVTPSFNFNPTATWQSTGIQVTQGEALTITANYIVHIAPANQRNKYPDQTPTGETTPAGFGYPVPTLNRYSFIGRIGSNGTPFEVGSSYTGTASGAGTLYLMINDNILSDNSLSSKVTPTITVNNTPLEGQLPEVPFAALLPAALVIGGAGIYAASRKKRTV